MVWFTSAGRFQHGIHGHVAHFRDGLMGAVIVRVRVERRGRGGGHVRVPVLPSGGQVVQNMLCLRVHQL